MQKKNPQEVTIQNQVVAYNAHDIEAFMALFAKDAEFRSFPGNDIFLRGYDEIKTFYTEHRFNLPRLRADIVHRMIIGDFVIDHEQIFGLEPHRITEVLAIYHVENDKIKTVWLIKDKKEDKASVINE